MDFKNKCSLFFLITAIASLANAIDHDGHGDVPEKPHERPNPLTGENLTRFRNLLLDKIKHMDEVKEATCKELHQQIKEYCIRRKARSEL